MVFLAQIFFLGIRFYFSVSLKKNTYKTIFPKVFPNYKYVLSNPLETYIRFFHCKNIIKTFATLHTG